MKLRICKAGLEKIKFSGILLTFILFISFSSYAQQHGKISRPKLVVGIVVDQMRWDYLYRYYDKYGNEGFKRLLNEGYRCENTFINYLPSATAVGHTTIFTGSVPAIDGIAGNEWLDQLSGRKWYCTEDTTVQTVGSSSNEGKMSPRNLLVSTITDELRLATNFQSRVIGVSLKDRAAILPAGHVANAAFWFDNTTGKFITSTYYMDDLPEWVKRFNSLDIPERLVMNGWNTLLPVKEYTESTADDVPWEGHLGGKKRPVFPYGHLAQKYEQKPGIIRSTPFGNTLTLEFAKAAIRGYRLGQKRVTDFLTINCASTDYAGHLFGPNSVEVEDVYLRLDKDLAAFFHFLDEKIGKGNYLVFLTADHGGAHSEGFMKEHGLPTGFWDPGLTEKLNSFLAQKTGVDHLILNDWTIRVDYQVNFDQGKIVSNHLNLDKIKQMAVEFLRKQPGILYAADMERVAALPIPEKIKRMMINGYNYKRSGPVQIVPQTGWLAAYAKKGTTHGTWNPYNTHIPLVFMGWHIKSGKTNHPFYMTDIAPTLAALLHIQMPNGCIGKPILFITNDAGL